MNTATQEARMQWAALLREAVDRRVGNASKPLSAAALKNMVVFQLREQGTTPASYDSWLNGESCPDHKTHEALLAILSARGSSDADQLEALRDARRAVLRAIAPEAERKTKPRVVTASRNGNGYIPHRQEREDPLLRLLREDHADTPYESMTPARRDEILRDTKSAAEYWICHRLNYNPEGFRALETRIGLAYNVFRAWGQGESLPDSASLKLLKRNYFHVADHAERFEKLVAENRRLLMLQAQEKGDNISFGCQLAQADISFAYRELREFALQNDARQPEKIDAKSTTLIVTQGIYLHFLRIAMGITSENLGKMPGFFWGCIKNIESGQKSQGYKTRQQYQHYLERTLAERDAELTAAEIAQGKPPSEKLSDLLFQPQTRARIAALPTTRILGTESQGRGINR